MNEEQSAWEIRLIATVQAIVDEFMAGKGVQDVTFKELPADPAVRARSFRVAGQDAQARMHQFEVSVTYLAQILLRFSAEQWTLPGMAHDARTLARALARGVECTDVIVYVATTDHRHPTYPWHQLLSVAPAPANRAAALARRSTP